MLGLPGCEQTAEIVLTTLGYAFRQSSSDRCTNEDDISLHIAVSLMVLMVPMYHAIVKMHVVFTNEVFGA